MWCVHPRETLDELVILYGIVGRIRLLSSDEVLHEAEKCCLKIVDLYTQRNRSVEHIIASFDPDEHSPLKPYSTACRTELSKTARGCF